MNSIQFEAEKNYQTSMSIAKGMLVKGIISPSDYEKMNRHFASLYDPLILRI